jgi:hypothetical protein
MDRSAGMMMNPVYSAGKGGNGDKVVGNDEHEGGALTLYSSVAGQTTGDVCCGVMVLENAPDVDFTWAGTAAAERFDDMRMSSSNTEHYASVSSRQTVWQPEAPVAGLYSAFAGQSQGECGGLD